MLTHTIGRTQLDPTHQVKKESEPGPTQPDQTQLGPWIDPTHVGHGSGLSTGRIGLGQVGSDRVQILIC